MGGAFRFACHDLHLDRLSFSRRCTVAGFFPVNKQALLCSLLASIVL